MHGAGVGSGIYVLPSALAAYGGISLFGWILTAVGATLLSLVFARLARRNPAAGGPYAYTRTSFGDFAYSMLAIAGAGAETVYWGFLLLLAGLPVYVAMSRRATAAVGRDGAR